MGGCLLLAVGSGPGQLLGSCPPLDEWEQQGLSLCPRIFKIKPTLQGWGPSRQSLAQGETQACSIRQLLSEPSPFLVRSHATP